MGPLTRHMTTLGLSLHICKEKVKLYTLTALRLYDSTFTANIVSAFWHESLSSKKEEGKN